MSDLDSVIEGLEKVWDAFNHMEHELYADYVFDALAVLKSQERKEAFENEFKVDEFKEMCKHATVYPMVYTSNMVNVVRCKDCIQHHYASNRVPQKPTWTCSRLGITVKDDWFCADGERREDERGNNNNSSADN